MQGVAKERFEKQLREYPPVDLSDPSEVRKMSEEYERDTRPYLDMMKKIRMASLASAHTTVIG